MVTLLPVQIEGHTVMAVEVKLPKTNLVALYTDRGYIMCGALDVGLLNEKLAERGILAGRAVGVRSVSDLLEAPLESVTIEAEKQGIHAGMKGRDALLRMI
ncbi:DUF1805 domain-containing protein [Paenibacillus sp. F411]|uniref:YunC family protein n=1 Tax=Paenibacillus sp. F411 TaxID=2820239 RepID=UPI001AB00525|nr:DUF1805 domain-containing protein [Paenibacillus sp. F411]MBO2942446.1 DUF1805 domain-containing protein [Paenibacillus sp. F411]